MEIELRGRDPSHSRHHRHIAHGHLWDGDHKDHRTYYESMSEKKVRFRSHSSPPPPISSHRYRIRKLSLQGRLDHDDEYTTWEKPVVFAPEEASYRPQRWLEKLEKLEAQIVTGSAQPGRKLHKPIPDSRSLQVQRGELHRLRPVLVGVRENLSTLQRAHYCSRSINMLVLEKSRKEVVRLVGLAIAEIQYFILKAIRFIDHSDIVSLSATGKLLSDCVDILDRMELRPRVLQEFFRGGYVRPSEYYEREWSKDVISSALVHALRAIAYTLDVAVVSFAGAHLEPFDEVYFIHDDHHRHHHDHNHHSDHHHEFRREDYYNIPCDEHGTSSILIYPRRFDCLSGFLGNNPAWVFEAHERGQILNLGRLLYLRTSPEQLANVWGPVWRAETAGRGGSSRFMLSKGFLIGWRHSAVDPPLYEGEYLCHWTDDPSLLLAENGHHDHQNLSVGLPQYININYLLIGAHTPCVPQQHPTLEINKHCPTTPTEIYHQLQHHNEMKNLGTRFAEWYLLASSNIPISVDPPGGFLGYGTELVFKRRQGTSCREAVCSKLVAQPWKYLGLLGDLYGVSISGCTGNARRVRLLDVILSPTMRLFVACQLPWVLDSDRWNHFRDLLLWHSSSPDRNPGPPDYVHISKHTTEAQRYDYARYLKLAVGSIKDLPISSASDHIDALFAYHGSEYRVRITPGESECGWLGLLNDSLTSFSAPVVEVSCCLECRPGGIFCHHHHHNHDDHHHRRPQHHSPYSPRSSSHSINDDEYHLDHGPLNRSGSSIRSPSVASTMSMDSSSRRSSFSLASGSTLSPLRRSHSSHISTASQHPARGHASHGYGTVLETTILVNPYDPHSPSILWPCSHRRTPYHHHNGKDKDMEEDGYYLPHDWDYMEYWNRNWTNRRRRRHHRPSANEMTESSKGMIKAYPRGTMIDLGDAGELYVLGHLLVITVVHASHRHAGGSASSSSSRSWSNQHGRRRREEEEVVLIVERRRPKECTPRTVRFFLEKVRDSSVSREFHHGELLRLDDIRGHADGDREDDRESEEEEDVVIIEESDWGRSRDKEERDRERFKDGDTHTVVSEEEEEYDLTLGIGDGNMKEGRETGMGWPDSSCLGRLLHVLVVSDVHDGLISEWMREIEVEESVVD